MRTEIRRSERHDAGAGWARAGVLLVPLGALVATLLLPACGAGGTGTDRSDDLSDADGPRTCNNPGQCDDLNPCTIDSCIGGLCGYAWQTDGFPCEDAVFCNGAETCMSGVCGSPGDPCPIVDSCDQTNARCLCDDGNPCTGPDVRQSDGTCQGPNTDGTLCGTCDAGGCRICCGGSCVNGNTFDHCAGCGSCSFSCGSCMQRESCAYSSTRACGWDWCCRCPC